MVKLEGCILKSDNVELNGQFQLGSAATPQQANNTQNNPNHAQTTAEVNIIEKNSQYAVIEITCSCGTKTAIKCLYAPDAPPQQPTEQPAVQTQ